MNVNFRQLEAFVQVARLGGFSRAATQLHLSQAGLSILIRKLEEKLDARLFERTTRQVVLTAAGRRMLPAAERILTDLQSLLATGREIGAEHTGHITLALPPRLSATLLPGLLRSFQNQYPRVSVAFRECINEEVVGRLYSRDVEFGFAFGIESNLELECQPLSEDALVAICAPEHPLARMRTVTWADLIGQRIITLPSNSAARQLIEQQFTRMNQVLAPVYEANSLVAIALAREGLGIAVVSSALTPATRHGDLVRHTLQEPLVTRPLMVVTRRKSALSEPARAFIELFATAAASRH